MNTIRRRWTALSRRITDQADLAAARLQHDRELLDAQIAAEHAAASQRAMARGERGCDFCR